MSNHQKRLSVPKSWPVERKTETFTVAAGAGPHGEAGVPLLVVLRDVLGYVDSRKEARFALNQGSVLVNGDAVADETRPIGMFDILAFQQREEFYRVFPDEGGRLALTPVDADAAGSRLGKVVSKQHVPGGDVQLTFHDGTNIRVGDDTAYGGGDSVVVDNETKEVVAHFPYEEGALVTAVAGQHAGEIGEIDAITVTPGSNDNAVAVETDDGGFETVEEYIVVIDENFVEGGESAPDADTEPEVEADEDADTDEEAVEAEADDPDADAEGSDAGEPDGEATGADGDENAEEGEEQ